MYSIVFNGTEITLPNYSFGIASKIEEVEASNNGSKKFRDKCKVMYNFESELIGSKELTELIGNFDSCDPNDINLLYLSIVACYNQPLAEYNSEKIESKLNDSSLTKMMEVLSAFDSISKSDILESGSKFGR